MLVTVGSVKGSPGTTTLAVLLAVTWPGTSPGQRPVVVEADCAGGDLGGRCWLPDSPGLTSLATAARTGHVVLKDHTAQLPCGVDVVVAPASRQASTIAVGLLAETGVGSWLGDRTAIADVGRLDPGAPSSELLDAADAVFVLSRGDEASLLRLSDAALARERTRLVLVGAGTYSSEEITQAVGLSVAAVLPWDPRAAQTVWGRDVPGRAWTKRGLPASVRALAASLVVRGPEADDAPAGVSATTTDRGRHSADRTSSLASAGRPVTPSVPETGT
jgi:hypothetical protein